MHPRSNTENAVTAAFRAVFGWCPVRDGVPPDAEYLAGGSSLRSCGAPPQPFPKSFINCADTINIPKKRVPND